MKATQDILVSVAAEGVATVTLNRPDKRNAISLAMWQRLGQLFPELSSRADVRSVILTGAGGHFSGGADISEFATVRNDTESVRVYEAATVAATRAVRDCTKPTIAAVSGYGMGGGCGLALACDLRVGDETTRMGIPAARLGIIYGELDCSLLWRAVGLANAKRVLYSGRAFAAQECLRMGLLDVVSAGTAPEEATRLAAEFAENAPMSLAGSKLVLEALANGTVAARRDEIAAAIDRATNSADYREGARAFMEKRKPTFTGR
jgi:enoyl-CoA hydratase/carnithine racemase